MHTELIVSEVNCRHIQRVGQRVAAATTEPQIHMDTHYKSQLDTQATYSDTWSHRSKYTHTHTEPGKITAVCKLGDLDTCTHTPKPQSDSRGLM